MHRAGLPLASQTCPQQLHCEARRIQPSLALFAQGTSSALLAAIVLSSRRLPDVFSQAQDRRRHYPSRQCSMHASNHATSRHMTGQLASNAQQVLGHQSLEYERSSASLYMLTYAHSMQETTGHSLRSSQSVLCSVSSCPSAIVALASSAEVELHTLILLTVDTECMTCACSRRCIAMQSGCSNRFERGWARPEPRVDRPQVKSASSSRSQDCK
jgi:hypothetical protein